LNSGQKKNIIYLLTGSNIGDRLENLKKAEENITRYVGEIKKKSNIYETEAWGEIPQDNFLNRVVEVETTLQATYLLKHLKNIETLMGRTSKGDYKPRTIDIDILYYNDKVINRDNLKIPHPQMEKRRFVLAPLKEVAPNKIHPILKKDSTHLLKDCVDTLEVYIFANSEV
jgi:2-amino-4-hydroxy-6-hydroxymethyldihydropteridine diphosphokinase